MKTKCIMTQGGVMGCGSGEVILNYKKFLSEPRLSHPHFQNLTPQPNMR